MKPEEGKNVTPVWALKFLLGYFWRGRRYDTDDATVLVEAAYADRGRTARLLDSLMLNLSISYTAYKIQYWTGKSFLEGFADGLRSTGLDADHVARGAQKFFSYDLGSEEINPT